MALQQKETLNLDPQQQQMLVALVLLHEKHPEKRFSYPKISDTVREQTKNKIVPTLKELQMAKWPLIDQGLIRDEGIGFIPTQEGIQFYHRNKQRMSLH